MKVAIINNIYPPYDRGGAEQVVVKTVAGLRAAGHRVVVITTTPGKPQTEVVAPDLTLYHIHPRNVFFYTDAHRHNFVMRFVWHVVDIFNASAARAVKEILDREKPDVVHTHNLMGLSFLLPRAIRQSGRRHVHTVHDVQLVEPSGMILKAREKAWRYTGLPTRLYTALMRALIGSPQVVISPSQFLRDFYTSRGFFKNSAIQVVRNPVMFAPLPPAAKPVNSTTRFGYIGQIETHKGVALLVESFQKLPPAVKAELHILGSGTQLEQLKKQTANDARIVWYGRVERHALPQILQTLDALVVPSLCYENSPTVIFESFACHVPVIASNIEGIAELIQEGENGFTFAAGNIASLTERLVWSTANHIELSRMGANTQTYLAGLSLAEYIARLESVYRI